MIVLVATKLFHESKLLSTVTDPVVLNMTIGTTSTLLVTIGVLLNLSKSSSIEQLMIGIDLVRNSVQ